MSIPKITFANFCKPIHDIMNYSTSICPFEFGKGCKGREKTTKIRSPERKELSGWNKRHFLVFEGLSLGERIRI